MALFFLFLATYKSSLNQHDKQKGSLKNYVRDFIGTVKSSLARQKSGLVIKIIKGDAKGFSDRLPNILVWDSISERAGTIG